MLRDGDGETETGAPAASWHSNRLLDPARDGAVLDEIAVEIDSIHVRHGPDPRPSAPRYVNVSVAGKQPALDYLTMVEAVVHCTRGLGIWDSPSNDQGGETDVVMACAGDIPTLERISAAALLHVSISRSCGYAWSTWWT